MSYLELKGGIYLVLFIMMLGMVAAGSAVVFVKLGGIDPIVLSSYRLLFSALILLPWFIKDIKRREAPLRLNHLKPSLLPGIFLALHFIFWIIGARLVPGAHASLITTMSPLVMPFVLYVLIRERITSLELAGSALALSGSLYLGFRDYSFASEYLKGDMICFLSMIFLTLYLSLARRHRKNSPFWFYMIPLYAIGGLLCLGIALITGADFKPAGSNDWISIAGLVLICTVGGHSINNFGMRRLRGQLVSLLNLTQIIFASLMSYMVFGEIPPSYFYPAALLILSGPLLVILGKILREKRAA